MVKGLVYTLEEDKIIEYMALSVEDKLQWLEDINKFNELFLSKKEKELMEALREGKI